MREQEPKRHHTVGQFYLKRFTDSTGLLYVLDLNSGKITTQTPLNTMVRKHFYKVDACPSGTDPNWFEKLCGRDVEPRANECIRKLIEDPSSMDPEEWGFMLYYLQLQRTKVPRQISSMRASALTRFDALSAELSPEAANALRQDLAGENFKFWPQRAVGLTMMKAFSQMDWEIATAPSGSSFITTDNPVNLCGPLGESGVGYAGTHVFFPLSSSKLLLLRNPEFKNGSVTAETILPEAGFRTQVRYFPDIRYTPRRVRTTNMLMSVAAERFIVANSPVALEEVREQHSRPSKGPVE
jgi:hypothetical protein